MITVMNFAVDLLYIFLGGITLVVFTKRGFIDGVLRYGRTFLAGVCSYFFGPVVSQWIYGKVIYPWIFDMVVKRVENFLSETVGSVDINGMIDGLPFFVKQLVDREAMQQKYGNALENVQTKVQDFARTVSQPFSSLLSNLIAYVLVFFVALVLLVVLLKLLDNVFKLPVLNTINKVLGLILGVFAAWLLLAAITFVLGAIVGIFGSSNMLEELVNASKLFRFFNDLSIFDLF